MKINFLFLKTAYVFSITVMFMSCGNNKNNVAPVTGFKPDRYLGKWYEIARLPNRFQKDLKDCAAEYSKISDRKIKVVNSGYHILKQKRRSSSGTAAFLKSDSIGLLKVSFFWPFSGLYKIMEIGQGYEYAVVVSSGYNYLWVLSRKPEMDKERLDRLLEKIGAHGFSVEKIIINSEFSNQK